jgi:hypothetical protein
MKRLASFLMLLPLSLFALGCGGDGDTPEEPAADDTAPATPDDGMDIHIPTDDGTPEPATDGNSEADGGPVADGAATPTADGTDAAADGENDPLATPEIKITPPSVDPPK